MRNEKPRKGYSVAIFLRNKLVLLTFLIILPITKPLLLSQTIEHTKYLDRLEQACDNDIDYQKLVISYPLNNTIFPTEIIPPVFIWQDQQTKSDKWAILFKLADVPGYLTFFSDTDSLEPGCSFLAENKRTFDHKTSARLYW